MDLAPLIRFGAWRRQSCSVRLGAHGPRRALACRGTRPIEGLCRRGRAASSAPSAREGGGVLRSATSAAHLVVRVRVLLIHLPLDEAGHLLVLLELVEGGGGDVHRGLGGGSVRAPERDTLERRRSQAAGEPDARARAGTMRSTAVSPSTRTARVRALPAPVPHLFDVLDHHAAHDRAGVLRHVRRAIPARLGGLRVHHPSLVASHALRPRAPLAPASVSPDTTATSTP